MRVSDLAAAADRAANLQSATNPGQYLRSLGIEISLEMDNLRSISRLHELSTKTNQFNTSLMRLSEAELTRRVQDPESRVVSASLKDKLSESGTIFELVARREGECLFVEELAISCRALGRGVETPLVLAALDRVLESLPAPAIQSSLCWWPS